jgi:hypothetical protein
MHHSQKHIGAQISAAPSLAPANSAAGTRNGSSIDHTGYGSCVLLHTCAAVTGAPSAQTIDVKLQDSADGTTFADVVGAALPSKTTGTAESREKNIDLSGLRQFVRVVEIMAFTGGTTPAVISAPVLILGGPDKLPV